MSAQVRCEHPVLGQPVLRQQPGVPAVTGDAVEEDDAWRRGIAPGVQMQWLRHSRDPAGAATTAGPAPHKGGAKPPTGTLARNG